MQLKLDEVAKRYGLETRGVVHVGANEGQEIDAYLEAGFSRFKMFEPLHGPFAKLTENVKAREHLAAFELFQVALGSSPDRANMFVASNGGASSSLLKPIAGKRSMKNIDFDAKETVEVQTLDRYIDRDNDFNFLVLDTQGFEKEVLLGSKETIGTFDAVICEINRDITYHASATITDIDRIMAGYGFTRMETHWVGRGWGDGVYIRDALVPEDAEQIETDSKKPRSRIKKVLYRLLRRS
ncbi:MAG: FkbM family methyltransferase [Alphaproteobacteria bacterium]|uniref:FkbM family methyltransferase n=1 Tax=Stappia stellulata TaxID=71235 RepID=UPI001CD68E41|nr:FkbM family methyltransferase [Stappia stellulata]MBL6430413.1 FkbM family methyltransferase [Alphaproteobacteria bacterium]MCA1242188.1 FkbM family methyltransferase [Stappia stellulata]